MQVDCGAVSDLANEQKIRAYPTFRFYKRSKQLDEIVGGNPSLLEDLAKKHSTAQPSEESAVTQMRTSESYKQAIGANQLVVVDFFDTICAPCEEIAPKVEEFAAKYSQVSFIKVSFPYSINYIKFLTRLLMQIIIFMRKIGFYHIEKKNYYFLKSWL